MDEIIPKVIILKKLLDNKYKCGHAVLICKYNKTVGTKFQYLNTSKDK